MRDERELSMKTQYHLTFEKKINEPIDGIPKKLCKLFSKKLIASSFKKERNSLKWADLE